MNIRKTTSGRILIELDGYSKHSGIVMRDTVTGKVSLPAEYAGIDEKELKNIALLCLIDNASRRDYLRFYKAKIVAAPSN